MFVVHGRNGEAKDAMFSFLRALDLQPIEWSQAVKATGKGSPYIGEVLDAAFTEATAVIVLLTPDEVAYLRSEYASDAHDPDLSPATQARPNVLFEAGMAIGRDSDRAILVELGDLRPFSDIAGRHAVRIDDQAASRKALVERLITAGCNVDLTGDDWLSTGSFAPPPPPGGGLPLGKKVPAQRNRRRAEIDLRYHDRSKSGRLEVVNIGTEELRDISLELPEEADGFHLMTNDLPISRLPPGKSVMLVAMRYGGLGRGHGNHFDVRVTGTTPDGDAYSDDVFLSLGD